MLAFRKRGPVRFFVWHAIVGSPIRAADTTDAWLARVAYAIAALAPLGIVGGTLAANITTDGRFEWPGEWIPWAWGGWWAVSFLSSIWRDFRDTDAARQKLEDERNAKALRCKAEAAHIQPHTSIRPLAKLRQPGGYEMEVCGAPSATYSTHVNVHVHIINPSNDDASLSFALLLPEPFVERRIAYPVKTTRLEARADTELNVWFQLDKDNTLTLLDGKSPDGAQLEITSRLHSEDRVLALDLPGEGKL